MTPVTKQAWLDALRSGDYGQCKAKLGDAKGNHCCLGVLCEVAGVSSDLIMSNRLSGGLLKSTSSALQYSFPVPEDVQRAHFLGDTSYAEGCLPSFVLNTILEDLELTQEVVGIVNGPAGAERSDKLVSRLMILNDEGDWTFDEIADYIEKVAK